MSQDKQVKDTVEVPEKFKAIIDQIAEMSVLDLSELVKVLEDKFNVSAAAPMMMAPGAAAGGGAAGEEAAEKTSFSVELTAVGDSKISVIKAVKEITQLGLKDAKELVEGAPKVIKADLPKDEAEELKEKLVAAGATAELK